MKQLKVIVPRLNIRKDAPEIRSDNFIGFLTEGTVFFAERELTGQKLAGVDKWYIDQFNRFYWGGGIEELTGTPPVTGAVRFPPRPFNWNKLFFGIDTLAASRGAGITVAVLDDGLVVEHDDLNIAFTEVIDTTDVTGDGVNKHGTAVAGIIGARNNNNKGITGVAPACKLVPIRISRPNNTKPAFVIAGIKEAVKAGADIINISMSLEFSEELNTLITETVASGIHIVASAGDQRELLDGLTFPARHPSCIAVGSCNTNVLNDIRMQLPDSLHFVGSQVERWVCSTAANGFYTKDLGSSFTCAYISGVLALLLSKLKQQGQNIKKTDRSAIINQLMPCITPFDDNRYMDNTGFGFDIVSRIKSIG